MKNRNKEFKICNELLSIIDSQENTISKQSEIISEMTADNMEKENIINVLLKDLDRSC